MESGKTDDTKENEEEYETRAACNKKNVTFHQATCDANQDF